MAKLKAPLFSFGASGKIADSLVYLPWKGLNNVRQYVVPANPNTLAQSTQRGYLRAAVAAIHLAEADLTDPLTDADKQGYSLLGSLQPTPRTWFNTIVKIACDQLVGGFEWCIFSQATLTPGTDLVTVMMQIPYTSNTASGSCKIWYGLSKTAMFNSIVTTWAELQAGKDVIGLVTGQKYYFQFKPDTAGAGSFFGSDSGIFYAVAG